MHQLLAQPILCRSLGDATRCTSLPRLPPAALIAFSAAPRRGSAPLPSSVAQLRFEIIQFSVAVNAVSARPPRPRVPQ